MIYPTCYPACLDKTVEEDRKGEASSLGEFFFSLYYYMTYDGLLSLVELGTMLFSPQLAKTWSTGHRNKEYKIF